MVSWAARPGTLLCGAEAESRTVWTVSSVGFSASQILPHWSGGGLIDFENGGKVRIRERGTGVTLLLLWARQNACERWLRFTLMKTGAKRNEGLSLRVTWGTGCSGSRVILKAIC